MKRALRILQVLRVRNWWQYKIAPLLGFFYMMAYWNNLDLFSSLKLLCLLLITIIGFAGIGHLINDYYDRLLLAGGSAYEVNEDAIRFMVYVVPAIYHTVVANIMGAE